MSNHDWENEIHSYDPEKHTPWSVGYKIYAAFLCILPMALIIGLYNLL